jgi:hypothetical protein
MPRRMTMLAIRDRCKQLADLENSSTPSDAMWNGFASQKFGELHGVVCDTGSRYFETSSTITATGAASYDEPDDHRSTVGMDRSESGGKRVQVFELMTAERNIYAGQTGSARYFAHVDDQIYLYPNPSSGTYYYLYVPQAPDLSSYADADLVDVCDESGEAFLIWGVVAMALAKLEQNAMFALDQEAKAKDRLVSWAARRMMYEPRRRVVDSWCEPGVHDEWWRE